jgi:hypothetical protein
MPIINPIYKIPIDPNLTAENLKAGVTVYAGTPYEVTGTLEVAAAPKYDVTINVQTTYMFCGDAWYSIDNGSTWIAINETQNTVVSTSQIKFKVADATNEKHIVIGSTAWGFDIVGYHLGTTETNNITITQATNYYVSGEDNS